MKQQLFCDHCDDILTLHHVVFAYGKKFCSPKCCKSWEEDRSRSVQFQTYERINKMPYRVER